MPVQVEVKNERAITVPVPADTITTEEFGKFLVNAGQDGFLLKDVTLIQVERGTQRDPWKVTQGVKITVSKP